MEQMISLLMQQVLSLITGLVGAVVFGVFIAGYIPKIRSLAERSKSGVWKRFYYRLLLAAMRGGAHKSQAFILGAQLVMLISVALLSISMMQNMADDLLWRTKHNQRVDAFYQNKSATTREENELDEDVRARRVEIINQQTRILNRLSIFGWVLTPTLFAAALFWLPYALARRRLAYEYERLMSRLPGVVSKDEFRDLCRAEMQVVDTASLDVFLRQLHELTHKYDLETIFVPK